MAEIEDLIHPDYKEVYDAMGNDAYFNGSLGVLVNEAESFGVAKAAVNVYLSMLKDVGDFNRVDYISYLETVILTLPDLQRALRKK